MSGLGYRVRHDESTSIHHHLALVNEMVNRSVHDGETRQLAVKIVSHSFVWKANPRTGQQEPYIKAWDLYLKAPPGEPCAPRDDECEVAAIWNFVCLNFRYVYDPADVDTFATVKKSLEAGGGDCFPAGTLLLRSDGELVPIEKIAPGMRIWGRDRWSEVTKHWFKGELPVTSVFLNNGSTLNLTEDHKVYVGVCHKHTGRAKSGPCSCSLEEREVVRIPVSEIEEGMVLVQPERVGLPEGEPLFGGDPVLAELLGLYLADGWAEESRIGISGKDGFKKEAQKERVAELAQSLGLYTSTHERYQRVYGTELASVAASLGHRALEKHLPHLRVTAETLAPLVAGLMADSGQNSSGSSRTFTTTSRQLVTQLRVLLRMLGVSCGYKHLEAHGGLGTHAIHRLYLRESEKGANKLLRVKEVIRETASAPCWDISTDDHYVYLPEHDTTVSNCDDATILFCSLLKCVGFHTRARVISVSAEPDNWVHVYPVVGLPKDDPTYWMPLDMTVDGYKPDDQYPDIGRALDFPM